MYKALKDSKIIAISDTDNVFKFMVKDAVVEDADHVADDYAECNGEFILKSEVPAPSKEEQSAKREQAYKDEVDGITAHISRLRDAEQTEEIIAEIAELVAERDAKVAEIKERYPYPTDPITEEPEKEGEENAGTQD